MKMLLHLHWLFIALFLLTYIIKGFLFLTNKPKFESFRAKTLIFESIMSAGFLITGIIMLINIGMANIGGWFHLKLTLVILGIPIGIIGFKKQNNLLVSLSVLMFLYVLGLALTKSPTLGLF